MIFRIIQEHPFRKAVVWTDTLQILFMFAGFLTVIVDGAIYFDGFDEIMKKVTQGGRIVNDFRPDVRIRHTFWTVVVGGTFGIWGNFFCSTQSFTQRYCKISPAKKRKFWSRTKMVTKIEMLVKVKILVK